MIEFIRNCFQIDKVFYTKHAIIEMRNEEFGSINDAEVFEAVLNGEVIEYYDEDEPYPSCLICGVTNSKNPLHIVCAFDKDDNLTVVITVYRPDPDKWIDFKRRKK